MSPPLNRRRDKPQLSCNFCRRRKLRCDRKQPCTTCSSRGESCIYPSSSTRTTSTVQSNLQERLEQLEHLVSSMVEKSQNGKLDTYEVNQQAGSREPDVQNLESSEPGVIRTGISGLDYFADDHWRAILDGIVDLKTHLEIEQPLDITDRLLLSEGSSELLDDMSTPGHGHSLLLYRTYRLASKADIIADLPSRSIVDWYISLYFSQQELISSTIHAPTFYREYENFWNNPEATPVIWIGLLFGMICLGMIASNPDEMASTDTNEPQTSQINLYRGKVAQSLILGQYTKAKPYALETMMHYVYIEFALRTDADKDLWFLLGLEINLAMRMGYHRDPRHFPNMLPLRSEMRRRIWTNVLQGEILISNQMGMPRMISDWRCDTVEPRNLNDSDLDETISDLPNSRPETENTTVLSCIARRRMLTAIGEISDLMTKVKPCTYEEVMRADEKLRKAEASVPPSFSINSTVASIGDIPQKILSRLFIRHLFYKGQIMLHRRFGFGHSTLSDGDAFSYSRKVCIDASLGMLEIQCYLDKETKPNGQLHALRWRVSSLVNHQFLTATMILCWVLNRGQAAEREQDITESLHLAGTIWKRNSTTSREARKAAETVFLVLSKFRRDSPNGNDMDGRTTNAHGSSLRDDYDATLGFGDHDIRQMSLGLTNSNNFLTPDIWGDLAGIDELELNFTPDNCDENNSTALNDWYTMGQNATWW